MCGSILDENHYEYDHLKRLNLLATQIPKQDLIVRRHVTSSGIEQDFLAIYGLALANGFELVPPRRVSGSRRLTAVLGLLDKRDLQFPGSFVRRLACQDICADDGIRYLMSPQQRSAFLQQSRHREVAEQYFPELNGELFKSADIEHDYWSPVSIPPPEECESRSYALE